MANLYVEGPTWIGEDNIFFPYSTVGVASQDLKYKGERAETRIGDRNRIREFVTIHRGTEGGGLVTRIGDDNLLMAYTHVAHDVPVWATTASWQRRDARRARDGGRLGRSSARSPACTSSAASGGMRFIGGVQRDHAGRAAVFAHRDASAESKVFGANKVGLERRGFDTRMRSRSCRRRCGC